jgi:dTDP-4-amino-4,6-dideoxygalactose transaminase
MDPIMALADEHGLKVIEDCAQAHGARYKGRSVGSIGHVGAWSFCQDKIMTTGGEGGMVTTNDEALVVGDVVVQGPWQELGGGL